MNIEILLYLVLAMIIYDFSIHLIYLLGKEKPFLKRRINYWPEWPGRKYQIFWTLFWGLASIILLSYIILN